MRKAALFCAALLAAGPAAAQTITAAEYTRPTTRYPHGVLGDDVEWGNLRITVSRRLGGDEGLFSGRSSLTYDLTLPDDLVFEDTAPRLWDVTGDEAPEIVVVQSHAREGARLLVIGLSEGKPAFLAATPFIGERNRWLAPVGVADLDGDGHVEIAYIDRPHLARILRIWRYENGSLTEIAAAPGLTNHRIGWDFIAGGIRRCGAGPEIVTANADWTRIMASRLEAGRFAARDIGPYRGPDSLDAALTCP